MKINSHTYTYLLLFLLRNTILFFVKVYSIKIIIIITGTYIILSTSKSISQEKAHISCDKRALQINASSRKAH